MTQCTHAAELIVCKHVTGENAEVEVLLVDDDGHVDYALCLMCGTTESPEALPLESLCRECGSELNIPSIMPTPGRWQVSIAKGTLN
jgi:hypothetical protein